MIKLICVTLLLIFCCSCSTLYWQQGLRQEQPRVTGEVWRHEFFFGFVQSQPPLDITQFCPEGSDHETIQVRRAPAQLLVSILSLGLYTPQSVGATCRKDL